MIPNVLIPLVASLVYGVLLFVVLRHRSGSKLNQAFALYLLAMTIWGLGSALLHADVPLGPLFWNKAMGMGTGAMPLSFFYFVQVFVHTVEGRKKWLYIGLASYLVFLIVNFMGYAVKSGYVVNGVFYYELGPAVAIVAVNWYFFVGFSIFDLVRQYRTIKDEIQRNRIRYALMGISVVVLGTFTNFTPLGKYPIDIAANLVNALLITYTIVRYELLDLTLVIRKALAQAMLTGSVVGTYLAPILVYVLLAQGSAADLHLLPALVSLVIAVAMAVSVRALQGRIENRVDRLFFRERYDAYRMVQELGQKMANTLDLDGLITMLLERVAETLHPKSVGLLLKEEATGEFYLAAGRGLREPRVYLRWRADHPISRWLSREGKLLTGRELDVIPQLRGLWMQEWTDLLPLGVELFVPLVARGNLVGILILSSKQSEEAFTADDRNLLAWLASQVAASVENARLYEAERAARQRLETLYRIGQTLNSTLDTGAILDQLTDEAMRATHAAHGGALVARRELGHFEVRSVRGYSPEGAEQAFALRLPLDRGLNGRAYRTRQVVCVDDVLADPDYVESVLNPRSELVVPIVRGDQVLGNLNLESPEVGAFHEVDLGFLQAVTDQVAIALENARLYEAVSRSQQEWEATFQAITDCICICDADLRILRANQALAQRLGAAPKDLIGRRCDEVLHCSADSLLVPVDERRINAERDEHILGSTFRISSFPLRDEEGQVVGSVQMLKDISEREALEEMWKRYEFIVNASKDSMALIGPDYTYKAVNTAFCEAHHRKLEQIVGKSVAEIWGHERFAEQIKEPLDQCFAGIEVHYQLWFGFAALGRRCFDVSYYPYHGGGRNITGAVVVSRDITDRQQAEDALREERGQLAQRVEDRTAELSAANAELARAARLKDEFLASMSHELRTPLSGILGLSEALQQQVYGPLAEKQFKALRGIEESGQHLLNLINDILDLSKIEAGKVDLQIGAVAVAEVCQASLRMIKEIAQKKRLAVSFNMDRLVTTAQADSRRLKQMLVNLLSNAVKFTPEEGSIGLEVEGDAAQKMICFTVWDTGIGIAREDVPRLFHPFVQLDGRLAREYSGTGLGLSLVRRMAEMHGGRVAVESEPGKGSRFTLTLPWAGPTEETLLARDVTPAPQQSLATEFPPVADQPLILLAEDNEITLAALSDLLRSRSFRVAIARNGNEALERAREIHPALILMDTQMPGMDGLEATRRIRAETELAAIPIIALTALAMPSDRERCLAAGANDYMSKPLSLGKLVKAIENQLAKS